MRPGFATCEFTSNQQRITMNKIVATLIAGLFAASTAIAADTPKTAAPAQAEKPAAAAPAPAADSTKDAVPAKKAKKHKTKKAKKAPAAN
jgi:hypothetical protein